MSELSAPSISARWSVSNLLLAGLFSFAAVAAEPAHNAAEILARYDHGLVTANALAAGASGDDHERLEWHAKRQRSGRKLGGLLQSAISRFGPQPDGAAREQLSGRLEQQFELLAQLEANVSDESQRLIERAQQSSTSNLIELEYLARDYDDLMSALLRDVLDNINRGRHLVLDVAQHEQAFDQRLTQRANRLADRLSVAKTRLDVARERLRSDPSKDNDDALVRQASLELSQERIARTLNATIGMMRERGLDVSAHVRLLIRTTGEISGGIFDAGVIRGLLGDWFQVVRDTVVKSGPSWIFRIVLFAAILLVFKALSRLVGRIVGKAVQSSKMNFSALLQKFFVTVSTNTVLLLGLLIGLSQMGFNLGPVLAGLGVVGFIVGFALQETLSNFASGIMILIYRPFDIGDVVEAGGVSGTISEMSLVSTTVLTFDNQKLVVPNNKIWGDVIRNVNAESQRRVDLVFGIGYSDDAELARSILEQILAEHELVLDQPEARVRLHTLGESSVDFIVRPWVKPADYWTVYWDVTEAVKQRFDAAGISIPFPQRDIHLYQQAADKQR